MEQIEIMAIELELHKHFRSFSALGFLEKYDKGKLSDQTLKRFAYMYILDKKITKEEIKEANKIKNS